MRLPASCLRAIALSVVLFITTSRSSAAQTVQPAPPEDRKPVGRFVAEARATFPKFDQDAGVASAIGVASTNLPTRTIGLAAGAHWYPGRVGFVTFGVGGEISMAHASKTAEPATPADQPGPTVDTRLSTVTPQFSANFGTREGWSYISGGFGWSAFTVERADQPLPDAESGTKTISYGGGARWFSKRHVGLSLDLRFYTIDAQPATASRPAYPKMRMMVMSGGIAFK